MDNPFKSPAVISFCPGILGIERGLKRAGAYPRVVAYVEIEAFIIANLVTGMEAGLLDPAPIWSDAKTFDARLFRGRIHGIIGGYPCPGESLAGLREGHLYKGFIWPALRRAVAATRPFFCFFENVDDHLTGTYPIVQRSLRNMGYRVEAGVYSAEQVGATHERKRLFILAVANSYSYGYGTGSGQVAGKSGENESKAQRQEWNDLLGQWMRDVVRDSGEKMADFGGQRLEGFGLRTGGTEQEFTFPAGSGCDRFPARPGEQQHDWEEPRTIERLLGGQVNGNTLETNILLVDYANDKLNAQKMLLELWRIVETEDIWSTHGRPWGILKEKVLFDVLLSRVMPQKLVVYICEQETGWNAEKEELSKMRCEQEFDGSSYRQKSIEQCSKEFANALLIMSFQITLARGQETPREEVFREMQCLRDRYNAEVGYVSDALSEIQKVWGCAFDEEEKREAFFQACKEYVRELNQTLNREDLLRALGNSAVEQTAELAFIDLMNKHLKNLK